MSTTMPTGEVWPPALANIGAVIQGMVDVGENSYYGREGWVEKLEDGFMEILDLPYAVATSSGTAALHSAFTAAGLGPADEVLCPTLTYLSTVTPVFHVNALPTLADCSLVDGNVTIDTILPNLTARTRAIVVTHMWGHPVDMDPIMALARERGLVVIEDCSHAHGTRYKGKLVGTIGDMAVFSLQARKLIVAGQGGILVTRNEEFYERAVLLGHFRVRAEQSVRQQHNRRWVRTGYGLNYRMHPFAACLAWHHLQHLERYIALREKNCQALLEAFTKSSFFLPPQVQDYASRISWYNFKVRPKPNFTKVLRHQARDQLCNRARAAGLPIGRPDNIPLHLEPLFQASSFDLRPLSCPNQCPHGNAYRGYHDGDFPVAEEFNSTTFNVAVFTETDFTPYAAELVTRLDALGEEVLRDAAGAAQNDRLLA
jgi:perosamine synthetase